MARYATEPTSSNELTASYPTSPYQPPQPSAPFQDHESSTASRSRHDYTFPEGGPRAWLVIFGSFSIICGKFGLISSTGLFQAYWQENQLSSYKPRDIGWISAVNVFLNLFLGVQIGPLFDRYGPKWLVIGGSATYVVSLVLLAQCGKYWQFMLIYGVLSGTSSAFFTTTALAVVAHCLKSREGWRVGLRLWGRVLEGLGFLWF
jgi:MFS family permease